MKVRIQYEATDKKAIRIMFYASLCFVSFILGCGHPEVDSRHARAVAGQQSFITPAHFIHQIRSTDSIIVSNRFDGQFATNENLSVKLTPEQQKDVLKAIASLKATPYDLGSASTWDLQLQFFHHGKLLGHANFQGASIVIDREYRDYTGVLDSIYNSNYDRLLPSDYRAHNDQ